jgi:signal transduction histidine kinase
VWGAALAATIVLAPYIQRANFVVFWLAVLFAAWYAGLAAAIGCALASVLAVSHYFARPLAQRGGIDFDDLLTFVIFVAAAGLVSALADRLVRINAALQAEAETRSDLAVAAHRARARAEEAMEMATRAAAEADAARADAEAADRAKLQFLATMSHELRTPLNAIQGHLQLLELELHGPVTDAQREAFARIDRAQRHLLGLINDVLNYARLGSGRVEYDIKPVLVRDVVADVLPMVEPQLAAKGLAVEVLIPQPGEAGLSTHPPVPVWADPEKLGQIFLNLLSNAIKFTPTGGRITVEFITRRDGSGPRDVAFFRVADTGIGIPADKLEVIFEPFVQVRSDYTRESGGTGLGLAISRDLARAMGGDLRVRSTKGEGSAFTVSLRRVAPAE